MITKQELQTVARQKGLTLGQTEKNYLHILTLFAISSTAPEQLIFKGGTSLMIVHGLPRFSEDLDFTATEHANIKNLIENIRRFLEQMNITVEITHDHSTPVSESYTLRYQGPLYTGTRQTTSKVELDISTREHVVNKTETSRIIHHYPDSPSFHIQTMDREEMLAEKIRAIMTRNKARDIYDVEYLLAKGIHINIPLLRKKLIYYDMTFSPEALEKALENKKRLWKPELQQLINHVPDFKDVTQTILDAIKKK